MQSKITVIFPDGGRRPLSQTPWAALTDAIYTVAEGGEDALAAWFEPINRPPIEDVDLREPGEILLHSFL
jgi:hypothetical protein